MSTLNKILTKKHAWLSDEKANWILQNRMRKFSTDLGLYGEESTHAMATATAIYLQMDEHDFRNTIARLEEHSFGKGKHKLHRTPPTG